MAVGPIINCLVCEGVRQEIQNKYTVLGFFGIAPHVRIAIRDFKLPVTLCFFFCGTTAGGKVKLSVKLIDRSGQQVPNRIPQSLDATFDSSNLATFIVLFFEGVVPGPGEYKVSLIIDEREHYSTQFALAANSPLN